MTQFMSPKVNVTEIDLTNIIPSVSTTIGGIAGVFQWGPAQTPVLITSEEDLLNTFGKPTSNNAETWWTAANFLKYSNKLYVSRAVSSTTGWNAQASKPGTANVQINNLAEFEVLEPQLSNNYLLVAKYPGAKGNSLRFSVCQSRAQFRSYLNSDDLANNSVRFNFPTGKAYCNVIVTNLAGNVTHATTQANTIRTSLYKMDVLTYGGNYYAANGSKISVKKAAQKVTSVKSIGSIQTINSSAVYFQVALNAKNNGYENVSNAWETTKILRQWGHASYFNYVPGTSTYVEQAGGNNDQMHLIIFDQDGAFTGQPGAVLEKYTSLSRATDAKSEQGEDLYWRNVINRSSKYVWAINPVWTNPDTTAANITVTGDKTPLIMDFVGGTDGPNENTISAGDLFASYDVFKKNDEISVDVLLAGPARGDAEFERVTNYLIEDIAEVRKDCIVCASPPKSYVVNNFLDPVDQVLAWRDTVVESSYAVYDSGYKQQYDPYNDKFWWIPLNGDIGGLIARTDLLRDAWWSPGGLNRGEIKSVTKLSWNPDEGERDIIYVNGINPVITIAGQGTYLWGDKTGQSKPSAFDRINVRRLFIVLEKAIAQAAKYMLFEFNDEFTRAQFKNMVDPYLRDIVGRRGIQDFLVVCDESNNTGEVIDRNEFVADIYIKPARAINFIQLNFVAVRSSVAFEEIVGSF